MRGRLKVAADDAMESVSDASDAVVNRASSVAKSVKKDADDVAATAAEIIESANAKLKELGVDTTVMAKAARAQASELQSMLGEELKARPMRALGVAAAFGIVVGLLTSR